MRRTIDGEGCVTALLRAGFRIHHRGPGFALLRRDARFVLVPSVGVLSPDMLDAILRSAGLSASELETHFAPTPTRSGMFVRPSVDAPPSSAGRRGRR